MLNLLQVQNTCERLAMRHWPQQEVSVYTVTKDCIATYLPRRARFRKPGTDTMDMIGDHLAVTSWCWKLGFSTLRDHFFSFLGSKLTTHKVYRGSCRGLLCEKTTKKDSAAVLQAGKIQPRLICAFKNSAVPQERNAASRDDDSDSTRRGKCQRSPWSVTSLGTEDNILFHSTCDRRLVKSCRANQGSQNQETT